MAGMYLISGAAALASQLKTLVVSTPIRSATSFWSIFNPRRLLRMTATRVATGDRADQVQSERMSEKVVWQHLQPYAAARAYPESPT